MAEEQTSISTLEGDGPPEVWDGVTYVVFAAERQCLPEDFEGRAEVANEAIGEPWKAYDLHDGRCPAWTGGHCQCGLVSCFSNGRWVVEVDVFHSVVDRYSLH